MLEILGRIDHCALCAMALCCRRFRELAQSLLFRTVAVKKRCPVWTLPSGLRSQLHLIRRVDLHSDDDRHNIYEFISKLHLHALVLGRSVEPPQLFYKNLRALSVYSAVPTRFLRDHPALVILCIGPAELRPHILSDCGPGRSLHYLECGADIATHGLLQDAADRSTRWVHRTGVLTLHLPRLYSEQDVCLTATALLQALGRSQRVPETLALRWDLALAISRLGAHDVVSCPSLKRLHIEVTYHKTSMRELLPSLLSHFAGPLEVDIHHSFVREHAATFSSSLEETWHILANSLCTASRVVRMHPPSSCIGTVEVERGFGLADQFLDII